MYTFVIYIFQYLSGVSEDSHSSRNIGDGSSEPEPELTPVSRASDLTLSAPGNQAETRTQKYEERRNGVQKLQVVKRMNLILVAEMNK